jgi:hypothetical protein
MIDQFLNILRNSTSPETDFLKPEKPAGQLFHSKILNTDPSDDAVERNVSVVKIKGKDTSNITKFKYKVGKYQRFALAAGLVYSTNNYNQSIATESNGKIVITNNTRLYRFIVGLNVYPLKGLYNQDNSLFGRFNERFSAFAGVGFPDPIENIYAGIAYDIVPGLKLGAGGHLAKSNRYLIQNNQIIEESLRYHLVSPYFSLTLDPTSVINLLNVFKK